MMRLRCCAIGMVSHSNLPKLGGQVSDSLPNQHHTIHAKHRLLQRVIGSYQR
jgi:hypothetical protein